MNAKRRVWLGAAALSAAAGLLAGCGGMMHGDKGGMMHGDRMGGHVTLSGANEVPPVTTDASGMGMVQVGADGAVSVHLRVSGMTATAAHIHEAAAGANGPVIVPLTKQGDDTFVSPAGARFTESQLAAYKAGRTYVNVHSAKNPPGEIRAQLSGN
ncbi:MAG: CHRD domain-containing protein [Usitatibacter sp.]